MKTRLPPRFYLFLLLTAVLGTTQGQQATLLDFVANQTDLSTFTTAVLDADSVVASALNNTLNDFTLFAPSNDAFANFDSKYLSPGFVVHLSQILLYHIHPGSIRTASTFPIGQTRLNMLNKFVEETLITRSETSISIRDRQFQFYNISGPDASVGSSVINGVAHVIDGVLAPSWFALNVADVLGNLAKNELLTFINVLNDNGFSDVFNAATDASASITVFAPTADAFANLTPEVSDFLTGGTDEGNQALDTVIKNHVLGEVLPSSLISFGSPGTTTLGPTPLIFTLADDEDETILAQGSPLGSLDNVAVNGIIHDAEEVLLPTLFVPGEFPETSLVEGIIGDFLESSSVLSTGMTLFMPTNTAFIAASQQYQELFVALTSAEGGGDLNSDWSSHASDLLGGHILPSIVFSPLFENREYATLGSKNVTVSRTNSGVSVDGIPIVRPNVVRRTAAIHHVNQMIIPSWFSTRMTEKLAEFNSEYSTLLTAVTVVDGLSDVLNSITDGVPFGLTLLAPTNDAFAKLPDGTLDDLLEDTDALKEILSYHVIPSVVCVLCESSGTKTVGTLLDGQTLSLTFEMRSGGDLGLTITDTTGGTAKDNRVNILAYNGILHSIDTVLMPELSSNTSRGGKSSGFVVDNVVNALFMGFLVAIGFTTL